MRMNAHHPKRRKAVNVSLDEDLVAEARALGVNLSRACEDCIARKTKAERERRWIDENLPAIEAWNAWVEENGLPFAEYRQF